MNKGVFSGLSKPNTSDNDPTTSIVLDNTKGSILRFFASGVTPTTKTLINTVNYPTAIRNTSKTVLTYYSPTWVARNSNYPSGNSFYDVAYANNLYVACGTGGTRTSTDGITWTTVTTGLPDWGTSVLYGNGLWLVSDRSGNVSTSTDGASWTLRTSNLTSPSSFSYLGYGNGLYLLTGDQGNGVTITPAIRSSTDGITWVTVANNFPSGALPDAIAYGNGKWVVGASAVSGVMRTSTDGVTWDTQANTFTTSINKIIYANNLFLAAGNGGQMATSTDGVTWDTQVSNLGTAQINALTYGNGLWMSGTSSGTSAYSPNAIFWIIQNAGFSGLTLRGLTFGNNLFVAVGNQTKLTTHTYVSAVNYGNQIISPISGSSSVGWINQ